MLGIKKADVSEYISSGYHSYARLLGIRKDRENILARIAKESSLTLLTTPLRQPKPSCRRQKNAPK